MNRGREEGERSSVDELKYGELIKQKRERDLTADE